MISATRARAIDHNAQHLGVKASDMMEAAGRAVAGKCVELYPKAMQVLLLCGSGNNGGDGFVAARYLKDAGYESEILLFAPHPLAGDGGMAADNLKKAKEHGVKVMEHRPGGLPDAPLAEMFDGYDLLVDSMLGVGACGKLREPYLSAARMLNASGRPVLSVDVPTGFGTGEAVLPQVTVTFHDAKEGMTGENSGRIIIVPIGIPDRAATHFGPGDLRFCFPVPAADSHKGDNGRVLVIGGGPYPGAPVLAAMAALRSGCDLVFLAVPQPCYNSAACHSPDLIVRALPHETLCEEDVPAIEALLHKADAVLVGPGLGDSKETRAAVQSVLRICIAAGKRVVVDADAVSPASGILRELRDKGVVFTPHAGEFFELTGKRLPQGVQKRAELVDSEARSIGATILLKGKEDIVSDGKETRFNSTGCAGMTVGGTGDVLAGVTASLLSRGVCPLDAAGLSAFINGKAGELCFEEFSYGMVASDLIAAIPKVLKSLL
ncbi:MAG: bifunctional ADP-dependent NAD(P)H-hydrate dehydratase/NAD(P)H-hydrate epimerase [Thermoplasmata archaeon HGW-Thermoplasmata-1]|nr:MAG: bifunctional ADP-dependent NAD(P)H-hydrate dehydratase/NAD(P)H-hydrate epimerase [Thermoplasmata archaeon HGW-Thermoplasmata-1]